MLAPVRERVAELYLAEIARARARVKAVKGKNPSAHAAELAKHLIDAKKQLAASGGVVGGLFGLASLPAELAFVTYLQLSLIVEIALAYNHNLKSERARDEVLTLLFATSRLRLPANAGVRLVGRAAGRALLRRGFALLGRSVPVVAAPVSAAINHRWLQRTGDEAVRFYGRTPRLPRRGEAHQE